MHTEHISSPGAVRPLLTAADVLKDFTADRRRAAALGVLFLAIGLLIVIADRAPMHLEKRFPDVSLRDDVRGYYDGVIQRSLQGPYVYRVLVPYGIAAVHALVPQLSVVNIDALFKAAALLLCQLAFFVYLRLSFTRAQAFAGVMILDALLPFTLASIQGPSIIETSDIVNVCVYGWALTALATDAFWTFCAALAVGTLNRETTWLLLPVLFFSDFRGRRPLSRSLIATLAVALPYFGLRLAIRSGAPDWFTVEGVVRNIPFLSQEHTVEALAANFHVLLLLGPLAALAFYRFRERPLFLRSSAIVIPFFLAVHYVVGWIVEARLWMPLLVILIPLALGGLETLLREGSDG